MPADLPPNTPPHRGIELVPLGEPADLTPPTADAAPTVAPTASAGRAYPHLVVEPVPAWLPPAVRTSRHPAATLRALPELFLVPDEPAGDAAEAPSTEHLPPVVDLTVVDRTGTEPRRPATIDLVALGAPAPTAAIAPGMPTAERLRAMLARERERISAEIDEVTDPTAPVAARAEAPTASIAPFPLPTADAPPRRVPKAVRPDATGHALRSDVAAAIARVTGGPEMPAAPSRARDRLEIVPLGPPALPALPAPPAPPAAPPRPLAAVVDLRDNLPVPVAAAPKHPCPACNAAGVVDVIDQITGQLHVSCPQCFRMWRVSTTQDASTSRP